MKNSRGFSGIDLLIILAAIVLLGICFWWAITQRMKAPPAEKKAPVSEYRELCIKGNSVIVLSSRHGAFYELDKNGKLVPCKK